MTQVNSIAMPSTGSQPGVSGMAEPDIAGRGNLLNFIELFTSIAFPTGVSEQPGVNEQSGEVKLLEANPYGESLDAMRQSLPPMIPANVNNFLFAGQGVITDSLTKTDLWPVGGSNVATSSQVSSQVLSGERLSGNSSVGANGNALFEMTQEVASTNEGVIRLSHHLGHRSFDGHVNADSDLALSVNQSLNESLKLTTDIEQSTLIQKAGIINDGRLSDISAVTKTLLTDSGMFGVNAQEIGNSKTPINNKTHNDILGISKAGVQLQNDSAPELQNIQLTNPDEQPSLEGRVVDYRTSNREPDARSNTLNGLIKSSLNSDGVTEALFTTPPVKAAATEPPTVQKLSDQDGLSFSSAGPVSFARKSATLESQLASIGEEDASSVQLNSPVQLRMASTAVTGSQYDSDLRMLAGSRNLGMGPDLSSQTLLTLGQAEEQSVTESFQRGLHGFDNNSLRVPSDSQQRSNAVAASTILAQPHQVRWDTPAVQIELVRMIRDGGGQVMIKLTPPDDSTFRIDLRMDNSGGATLVVDGASDSVRSRLEQGADTLRTQFSAMGFDLELSMNNPDTQSGSPGLHSLISSTEAANGSPGDARDGGRSNQALRLDVESRRAAIEGINLSIKA